jgi:small acid-soluble spore protein H (minor)
MDKRRAAEIASSPIMTNVTYNGMSIYIENVDEENGTADIHPINQPNNRQEVSISSLVEH